MTDLIPLQAAYITKGCLIGDPWRVCEMGTDKELTRLDGSLGEKEAMSYLHFGRKFELEALNIGIHFGTKQEHDKAEKVFQKMKGEIKSLEEQNVKLSKQLEKHIIGKGE